MFFRFRLLALYISNCESFEAMYLRENTQNNKGMCKYDTKKEIQP